MNFVLDHPALALARGPFLNSGPGSLSITARALQVSSRRWLDLPGYSADAPRTLKEEECQLFVDVLCAKAEGLTLFEAHLFDTRRQQEEMLIKQFLTGGDRNFGYLAADDVSKKALVVDPSFSPEMIVDYAREKGYEIAYIFVTHDHIDHTNGNHVIGRLTGKQPLLFRSTDPTTGTRVEDGAQFPLGSLEVTILHTPGHTEDSICIHIGDAVFTGDTLFVGKVGGTDFGLGAQAEYVSLHKKLLALPDSTRVFPGHDYGIAAQSTIGKERNTNPFLLQSDLEAFVHLKQNWLVYKKEHQIA